MILVKDWLIGRKFRIKKSTAGLSACCGFSDFILNYIKV